VSTRFDIFEEWREADRQATRAELALLDASLLALRNQRDGPSDADVEHARRLRAHAAELFRAAMQEVHTLNERAAGVVQTTSRHLGRSAAGGAARAGAEP
jgi:hypothetical protein